MKGVLKSSFSISENETILEGTEIEIIDRYNSDNYLCEIKGGRKVVIWDGYIKTEERIPWIDWEQRRYELAKSAMQGYCASSGLNGGNLETCKKIAIESLNVADAMIKKLKEK